MIVKNLSIHKWVWFCQSIFNFVVVVFCSTSLGNKKCLVPRNRSAPSKTRFLPGERVYRILNSILIDEKLISTVNITQNLSPQMILEPIVCIWMDEAENSVKTEQKPVILRNECLNTFDELLKVTGGFGRYQRFLFKFLSFGSILVGAQFGLQYFYGATPDFSCVSMPHNETCDPGKCCESCQKYEFHGPFTSAVSQVNLRPGEGTPHMKGVGMLVVSLRGVNFGFWSYLGCYGQNAIIFSREGLV